MGRTMAPRRIERTKVAKKSREAFMLCGLGTNGLKRMRTRYVMCENCANEFYVADNRRETVFGTMVRLRRT